MEKSDLQKKCNFCEGVGIVSNPVWIEWNQKVKEVQIKENISLLEASDKIPMPPPYQSEEIPCYECEGIGSLPTEQGKILLEFIRTFNPERSKK